MQINSKSIQDKVSRAIKAERMQTILSNSVKSNNNAPVGITESEINKEIRQLKQIIFNAVKDLTKEKDPYAASVSIRWNGVSYNDLLIHKFTNVQRDKNNVQYITSCQIDLYFNPDIVRSPSLFPKGQGVDNIVRLLTNGWDLRYSPKRGRYKGTWYVGNTKRGRPSDSNAMHNTEAKLYRRPNTRFIEAIIKYNSYRKDKNIYAILDSSYKGYDSIGSIRFGK